MKSNFQGLVAVALLAFASCGGGGTCRQGCDRLKACAQALRCTTADPLQKLQCEQSRKALLDLDCDKVDLACPDDIRPRLEQAATCTLSTVNCECLQ